MVLLEEVICAWARAFRLKIWGIYANVMGTDSTLKAIKLAKCEICNKIPRFGRNVSHSKRHTPRMYRPNVHPVRLMINGKRQRMKVCTRCLRTQYKQAS